ncbi:hypothetical protein VST7929_01764 [Vibrio stylophorae]|uniref:DUF1853 family protein n=1 Tax=Vibrio stylophorae TaxID=659351 RepID=A0ABN8DUZ9_9VIBR|nr:DUF1853 family protein [Vibrio stylophorae]CAH0533887.1 hypothetical protein VST7929_01764 [Vibrio stylophorae]
MMKPQTHFTHPLDWLHQAPSLVLGHHWIFTPEHPLWQSHSQQWPTIPQPLPRAVGHYYQLLWRLWIQSHPMLDLVAEEIQIQGEQRTLGAIDFIVHNKINHRFEHWEVACKFYLAYQGQWLGPNASDSLTRKMTHMLAHQLPLSQHDTIAKRWPIKARRLILQGRLYTARDQNQKYALIQENSGWQINPNALQGWWRYQPYQGDEPILQLHKPNWLTQARATPVTSHQLDPHQSTHIVDPLGQFGFIMPQSWPNLGPSAV